MAAIAIWVPSTCSHIQALGKEMVGVRKWGLLQSCQSSVSLPESRLEAWSLGAQPCGRPMTLNEEWQQAGGRGNWAMIESLPVHGLAWHWGLGGLPWTWGMKACGQLLFQRGSQEQVWGSQNSDWADEMPSAPPLAPGSSTSWLLELPAGASDTGICLARPGWHFPKAVAQTSWLGSLVEMKEVKAAWGRVFWYRRDRRAWVSMDSSPQRFHYFISSDLGRVQARAGWYSTMQHLLPAVHTFHEPVDSSGCPAASAWRMWGSV